MNEIGIPYQVETSKTISGNRNFFRVVVQIIINDSAFEDRLTSLDSYLYYSSKGILSSLVTRKSYNFQINDILSISNLSNASPHRAHSYLSLTHGVHVSFAEEKEAEAFQIEIEEFLSKQLEKEYRAYQDMYSLNIH